MSQHGGEAISRRADCVVPGNPAMPAQRHIFGRGVIPVGNHAGPQPELLGRFEGVGTGDEIRRQPASKEVARRAGGQENKQPESDCNLRT